MKTLLQLAAVGIAMLAFSTGAPVRAPADAEAPSIELACKPRGTACHTSFECCSQKCQPSNGVDTCH